jgi:hypothetical protein
MMEWRRHPRVREEIAVRWLIPKDGLKGKGIVRNLSISGLLLEVEGVFKPAGNDTPFPIEVIDGAGFIPKNAQVVWSSHIDRADQRRRFCGLKFVDPTGPTFTRLKEHIDGRLDIMLEATNLNIMNHYLHQYN